MHANRYLHVLAGCALLVLIAAAGFGPSMQRFVSATGLTLIYFIPSLLPILKKETALYQLPFINLLVGWTVSGWIAILAVAISGVAEMREARSLEVGRSPTHKALLRSVALILCVSAPASLIIGATAFVGTGRGDTLLDRVAYSPYGEVAFVVWPAAFWGAAYFWRLFKPWRK